MLEDTASEHKPAALAAAVGSPWQATLAQWPFPEGPSERLEITAHTGPGRGKCGKAQLLTVLTLSLPQALS